MDCLIIGAFKDTPDEQLRELARWHGYVVGCDGGYDIAVRAGVAPDLVIGDFDSGRRPSSDGMSDSVKVIALPKEKEKTDSFAACEYALDQGFDRLTFTCMWGGRADHMLANLYLLEYIRSRGGSGVIVTGRETLRLCERQDVVEFRQDCYFSLIALSQKAEVSISGAKYNAEYLMIRRGEQSAVSNEFAGGDAQVTVHEGTVLLVVILIHDKKLDNLGKIWYNKQG